MHWTVIAFSALGATVSAIAGIIAYLYVMRRLAGNPEEILNRCQGVISRLEKDLSATAR